MNRSEHHASGRPVARFAGLVSTAVIVLSLAATVTAQLVRDRTNVLALSMYVPIWPLALSAVLRDALARGRALRLRWLLLAIGVAAGAFSVLLMWDPPRAPEGSAESPRLTIAQWNMQWGGARGPESLAAMAAQLQGYRPDVICVSEAPAGPQLQQVNDALSEHRWYAASVEHSPGSEYWFRMTVLGRQPVVVRRRWPLAAGHAALFEVALAPRPLRVLMVDLKSDPLLPRSPTIVEVARILDELAAAEATVDVVTGDFNTPGRFLGFDAVSAAAGGYRRAALWSGQWRATWPARMPLSSLDIDHLWVSSGLGIASAHLFSNPNSDHRGQLAALRLPRAADEPSSRTTGISPKGTSGGPPHP